MKTIFVLIASIFTLAACGNQGDTIKAPPAQLVGTWVADGTQTLTAYEKLSTEEPTLPAPIDESDECFGFGASADGVDAGVMRIEAGGAVSRALRVGAANDPYVRIGSVNTAGQFVATSGTETDYMHNFDGFLAPGAVLSPLIHLKYSDDLVKGPTLEMEVQITMTSTTGFYTSPVTQRRFFRKISTGVEKNYLNKASQCFEKVEFMRMNAATTEPLP